MPKIFNAPTPAIREISDLIDSIDKITNTNGDYFIAQNVVEWITGSTRQKKAALSSPGIFVFIENHNFAEGSASGIDCPFSESVSTYINHCQSGRHKLNQLVEYAHCDLRIFELTPPDSPKNIPAHDLPAQTMEQVVKTMAYGMLSVEAEIDFYIATAHGTGTDILAKAIISAHIARENSVVTDIQLESLLKRNNNRTGLDCLHMIGGGEISAICGAILACRLAGIPIALEGYAGYAALLILKEHCPHIDQHCALIGNFEEQFRPADDFLLVPPPYDSATEPGMGSACLIPQFRNELLLNRPQI